jgi:hypothetical protein
MRHHVLASARYARLGLLLPRCCADACRADSRVVAPGAARRRAGRRAGAARPARRAHGVAASQPFAVLESSWTLGLLDSSR